MILETKNMIWIVKRWRGEAGGGQGDAEKGEKQGSKHE